MNADRLLAQEKAPFAKVQAPCPYFGTCGGCTLQDLSYADQLALKQQRLLRILGPLDPSLSIEVVGMEDPWRYRNKSELTFGSLDDQLVVGYHAARSFWRIVDLEDCLLLPQPLGRLMGQVRAFAKREGLSTYNPRSHQGFLRYLVLRMSHATGHILVCLVTTKAGTTPAAGSPTGVSAGAAAGPTQAAPSTLSTEPGHTRSGSAKEVSMRAAYRPTEPVMSSPARECRSTPGLRPTQGDRAVLDRLAEELTAFDPNVRSVYWGLNTKVADVAVPEELFLLRGEPYLDDRIGPFTLKLHPLNFLQPTPVQAERMYQRLIEWASHSPSGVAWDLYCGVGLIAFYLASKFRTVYGIDSDARNLEMGRLNAAANGIGNVEFRAGRAEDVLADKRFWLLEAKPDLVVIDPPRSGLHPRVIASLLAARPKQLLYLSCNAQALARDLQQLTTGFPRYHLRRAVAFDLFPHTNHLEILTLLERS